MKTRRVWLAWLAGLAACWAGAHVAAKPESWKDEQGKTFKGEPAGLVGPYAMFNVGSRTRGVRLRGMSAADCVRFHAALEKLPARAPDWAKAESKLSREIFAHAMRRDGERLVSAELAGRPEPEIFVLLFGWHDHGDSWEVLGEFRPRYERLIQEHAGLFEAVFFGVKHDAGKNARMIANLHMPWLVANFQDQANCRTAMEFSGAEPPQIVIVSRLGTLIYGAPDSTKAAMQTVMERLESLLPLLHPEETETALDRQNYLRAVQPVIFRAGRSAPVLIASPLDAAALQQAGVTRLAATLRIGKDGAVKRVAVKNDDGGLAPELVEALGSALKMCLFVAAVENGSFVEADYEYRFGAR